MASWWKKWRRRRPDNNNAAGTEGRSRPTKPMPPYPTGGDRADAKFPRHRPRVIPLTSDEVNRRSSSHAEGAAMFKICPKCSARVMKDPLTGEMIRHRRGNEIMGPWCTGDET